MTEEQRQLIEDCEARESRLTEWERDFIDSIGKQSFPLTSKQAETLDQIWDKATAKG